MVPAVEVADVHGRLEQVLEDGIAHQAEGVAAGECRAKPQPEVVIDLLEHEAGSPDALVESAGDRVHPHSVPPGLPERCPAATGCEQDRERSARVGMLEDLVHRLVREQRHVGVTTAGGERPIGPREQPEVAVAYDVHQERRHAVDVRDPGIALTVDRREPAVDDGIGHVEHGASKVDLWAVPDHEAISL
jgi:hypothetical protein